MKALIAAVTLLFVLMVSTYHGHGTEHIKTTTGTCYGQNRYEMFWVDDPIQNPWVIEECH